MLGQNYAGDDQSTLPSHDHRENYKCRAQSRLSNGAGGIKPRLGLSWG